MHLDKIELNGYIIEQILSWEEYWTNIRGFNVEAAMRLDGLERGLNHITKSGFFLSKEVWAPVPLLGTPAEIKGAMRQKKTDSVFENKF